MLAQIGLAREIDVLEGVENYIQSDGKYDYLKRYQNQESISAKYDQLHAMIFKMDRDKQVNQILSIFEALPFNIEFSDEIDEDPKYIEPWLIKNGKIVTSSGAKDLTAILKARIATEVSICGLLKFRNQLLSYILANTDPKFDSRLIQHMKYYCDQYGYDQFVENMRGNIELTESCQDTMASTRMLVLLNGSNMLNLFSLPLIKDAVIETCLFIFQNPFVNTLKIKDATSNVKLMLMSKSERGKRLVHLSEAGYMTELRPLVDMMGRLFNDVLSFNVYSESVKEDLDLLTELGLHKLKAAYEYAFSCDVNDENLSSMSFLIFPECFAGFLRMNKKAAALGQTDLEKFMSNFPDGHKSSAQFKVELQHIVKQFMDKAVETGKMKQTYRETVIQARRLVTTKSAGMGGLTINMDVNGQLLALPFNDKSMWSEMAGLTLWMPWAVYPCMTNENPSGLGFRSVVSRNERAIWVVPLPVFYLEALVGFALYEVAHHFPEFSVGHQSGSILKDHFVGAQSTGDGSNLIMIADFSQFDFSEKWTNVQRYLTRVLIEEVLIAFNEYDVYEDDEDDPRLYLYNGTTYTGWYIGFEGRRYQGNSGKHIAKEVVEPDVVFGPWHSRAMTVAIVRLKYKSAAFDFKWNGENLEIRGLDQVHSGQRTTLIDNSFTSRAYQQTLISILQTKLAKFGIRRKHFEVLGDDQFGLIECETLTEGVIKSIAEIIVDVAHECGLIIKMPKTGLRKHAYEYLKVRFLYGMHIPQNTTLMLFCGEGSRIASHPLARAKDYRGLYETAKSRGYDYKFLDRMARHNWNITRVVMDRRNKINHIIPFEAFHLPLTIGGAGYPLWYGFGVSTDSLCLFYSGKLIELLDRAAKFADALKKTEKKTRIARDMIKMDINGKTKTKTFKAGKEKEVTKKTISVKKQELLDVNMDNARSVIPFDVSKTNNSRFYNRIVDECKTLGGQGKVMRKYFIRRDAYAAAAAAEKSLASLGISIGDLTLEHAPERGLIASMTNNPKMVTLSLRERSSFNIEDGGDMLFTKFQKAWPDDERGRLNVAEYEELEEAGSIPFIANLHSDIKARFSQLGGSVSYNGGAISAEDLMKGLRSHGLPSDISAETIIRLFRSVRQSNDIGSANVRALMLQAMGVEESFAVAKALEMTQSLDSGYFNGDLTLHSFNGPVEKLFHIDNVLCNKLVGEFNLDGGIVTMYLNVLMAKQVFAPLGTRVRKAIQIAGIRPIDGILMKNGYSDFIRELYVGGLLFADRVLEFE